MEWISQRIQFEDEDGIEEERNKLLLAGKAASKARKLKINSGKNKRKNNPINNSSGNEENCFEQTPHREDLKQHPYNDTIL